MTSGRESRIAFIIAIGCFSAAVVTAVVDTARAVDKNSQASRTKATAEIQEALLRRAERCVSILRRVGDPPMVDADMSQAGIRILSVQTEEFSWSMDVEGTAGSIRGRIGPNLRAARITHGATLGTLRAKLDFDSPSLPRALFTPERVEDWVNAIEVELIGF